MTLQISSGSKSAPLNQQTGNWLVVNSKQETNNSPELSPASSSPYPATGCHVLLGIACNTDPGTQSCGHDVTDKKEKFVCLSRSCKNLSALGMHMMPASYQSVLHGPVKTQPGRGHFCFGHLAIAWRLLLIQKYMFTTICTQLTQCKVRRVKPVAYHPVSHPQQ